MFIDKDCFEYQISGIDFGHKDRATRFKTVSVPLGSSEQDPDGIGLSK